MKILLAKNSPDGVISSLIFQEHFETCDPLFFEHEKALVFNALGMPVYSVGVPVKGACFYIDTEGGTKEDEHTVIRKEQSLAHIANSLFPQNSFSHLVEATHDVFFWCFFELYGANLCFNRLKSDSSSWKDENVKRYKELQENLSKLMLSLGSEESIFVVKLPKGAGEYCRRLTFNKTDSSVVLFIDRDKFYAYGRNGCENALLKIKGLKITERKDNRISGYISSQVSVKKLKERLEMEVSKVVLENADYPLFFNERRM